MTTQTAKSPGLLGTPVDRYDGIAKVTGTAIYAGDMHIDGMLVGVIVGATIPRGRVIAIDTTAAQEATGVRLVLTHASAPEQAPFGEPWVPARLARPRPVLADREVRGFDEPVALVVADTFEQARSAAALVDVRYERTDADLDFAKRLDTAYVPDAVNPRYPTDSLVGDFEAGMAAAAATVDAMTDTPFQRHNPIEPNVALARWEDDQLTVWSAQQMLGVTRAALAATLKIEPEKIRVISPFVGGGFGSKINLRPETVLAAIAARQLSQPVKVTQTRRQMFANTGGRGAIRQRVRLGATKEGRLTALAHEVWAQTARHEEFAEQVAITSRSLYGAAAIMTRHRLVRLDVGAGEPMRAPGDTPGLLAIETAMDKLADRLGLDPVALRLANIPAVDPDSGKPFSTHGLAQSLTRGAELFGWSTRDPRSRSRSDGRWLVGTGVASAIRPNYMQSGAARVRLGGNGIATVQIDMTDLGTGTYTILAQVAAEELGLPMANVIVELGDTAFPATPGSAGSFGAAVSGSAVQSAARSLKLAALTAAAGDARSPLNGTVAAHAVFADGGWRRGDGAGETLAQIAARAPQGALEATGKVEPGPGNISHAQFSFGAFFAEVGVDRDTGEVRVRRMLGTFAAGRILNPKLARSQLIGGMVWGISSALHEEALLDHRTGAFVNRDLAGYHVPVHADIPRIEVTFIDEHDPLANPLGSKGIGELGACGSNAAIANAVAHATGVRVRQFPITPDRLVAALAG